MKTIDEIMNKKIEETRNDKAIAEKLGLFGLYTIIKESQSFNLSDSYIQNVIDRKNEIALRTENAAKIGFIQGVCECIAAIDNHSDFGEKLLSEMSVTINNIMKNKNNAAEYTFHKLLKNEELSENIDFNALAKEAKEKNHEDN